MSRRVNQTARRSGSVGFGKKCCGLALVLAASSLCTPYPERLWRAVNDSPAKPKPKLKVAPAPQVKPEPAPKPEPKPEPAPEPKLEPAPEPEPPALQLSAWDPYQSFSMPLIQLPPFPPALPERVEAGQYDHINSMERGISIHSNVNFQTGTRASQDRLKPEAFQVKVSLELMLPEAGDGADLLRINPSLSKMLPQFEGLMQGAKVSPWYPTLMLHKQNRLRKDAATLSRLLDRHNFYDTETVLEIEAPETKRKVLWIQADMDVVSDGSDGDRLPVMPKEICESDYYQPTTSYRWEKQGDGVNPLLPYWEKRLADLKKNKGSASSIDYAQRIIYDLKRYSYLLADYDPFIVLSLTMLEGASSYKAQVGDFAVVIVGKKAYPAIIGDYGPRHKSGEASLRLSREINPRATTYARPVSDLSVSYIIFPASKDAKHGPLDYERLYTRCSELLDEIGGLGEGFHLEKLKDKLAK